MCVLLSFQASVRISDVLEQLPVEVTWSLLLIGTLSDFDYKRQKAEIYPIAHFSSLQLNTPYVLVDYIVQPRITIAIYIYVQEDYFTRHCLDEMFVLVIYSLAIVTTCQKTALDLRKTPTEYLPCY